MKITLSRNIQISKSPEHVYSLLANFANWATWSPWAYCDPESKVSVEGFPGQIGHFQTWDGKIMGSGKMTLAKFEKNKLVGIQLDFYTPFKSTAYANLEIQKISDNACQLTWSFESNLPWFFFFFKKSFIAYMQNDFQRGLRLFKELAETGNINSKAIYHGVSHQEEMIVVGKTMQCSITELTPFMSDAFQKITGELLQGRLVAPLKVISLTHDFDMVKGVCKFTAGFAYAKNTDIKVPEGYEQFNYPAHNSITVEHKGPYRHLANPWAMAMMHQRTLKKKMSKTIPPYEIYKTLPDGRAESEIITEILVPLR